jgi:hypothetical protein
MSEEIRPYFGAEAQQEAEQAQRVWRDRDEQPEREVGERDREEQRLESPEQQDHEAHAPGKVCERCGAVIVAGQDARLKADGNWVHEVCPLDLG